MADAGTLLTTGPHHVADPALGIVPLQHPIGTSETRLLRAPQISGFGLICETHKAPCWRLLTLQSMRSDCNATGLAYQDAILRQMKQYVHDTESLPITQAELPEHNTRDRNGTRKKISLGSLCLPARLSEIHKRTEHARRIAGCCDPSTSRKSGVHEPERTTRRPRPVPSRKQQVIGALKG